GRGGGGGLNEKPEEGHAVGVSSKRRVNHDGVVEGGDIGAVVGQGSVEALLNRGAGRIGVGIFNVIKSASSARIVKARAGGWRRNQGLTGRNPSSVCWQDVVGYQRVFEPACGPLEGPYLEAVCGGLHRDQHRV